MTTTLHILGIKEVSWGEVIERAVLVDGVGDDNRKQEVSIILGVVILVIKLPTNTYICLMVPTIIILTLEL